MLMARMLLLLHPNMIDLETQINSELKSILKSQSEQVNVYGH